VIRLQSEPIRAGELLQRAGLPGDGAMAQFLGIVRERNAGRRVLYLEYEAYPEMAEAEMTRIAREAVERYGVSDVAVVHRTGRVDIGEISVAVVVSGGHRTQTLEACRFIIDSLKRTVPLWKKEVFEGGAEWLANAEGTG
jgi:molybdopterin synthase catalytic subunit